MKDTFIGEIIAYIATITGVGIALFGINKNSIARSKKAAIEHTRMNLKIIEIETNILEMKSDREKDNIAFEKLIEKLDKRHDTMMDKFEKDNKADHLNLHDVIRQQTGIISTTAAGVARIEGVIEMMIK